MLFTQVNYVSSIKMSVFGSGEQYVVVPVTEVSEAYIIRIVHSMSRVRYTFFLNKVLFPLSFFQNTVIHRVLKTL